MVKNKEEMEREETRKKMLSKFFLNLSKTTICSSLFAIIIVSAIEEVPPVSKIVAVMAFFIVLSIVFAVIGFKILRK